MALYRTGGGDGGSTRPYTYSSGSTINKTLDLKKGDIVGIFTQNANATNMKVNNVAIPSTGSSNTDVTTVNKTQYSSAVIVLHDGQFSITCSVTSGTTNRICYPIQ